MIHNSLEIITPLSEKQRTRHGLEHSLIEVIEEYQALSFIKGREDLINILGYISLLTKITVAALEAFEQKDWPKFDALVGDCGCQMRAAKIKDLADLFNMSEDWRHEIATTKGEAQQILEKLPALLKQIETSIVNDTCFIEKYGVAVTASFICKELRICQQVSLDIRFIIESFLLTETKMVTPNENCFYKNYYESTNPSLLSGI